MFDIHLHLAKSYGLIQVHLWALGQDLATDPIGGIKEMYVVLLQTFH